METLFTVVHVLAAIFMIVVIIVQGGNSGGMGAAFGGGNSAGMFGAAGATSFLGKLTYIIAGVFMATSILLSIQKGTSGKTGLSERLKEAGAEQKKEPTTPPPATPANPAPAPEGSAHPQ